VTSARRAGTVFWLLAALVLTASAATTTTTVRKATTTSTSTTAPPEAARQSVIDTQLRSLREQVEEASAEEADVLDKLDEVAASKRSLDRQVSDLDGEIATAQQELESAAEHLGTVTADLQRAEVMWSATNDDLDHARDELTDRAVRAYVHQPTAQLASVLLERQSFRDLASARNFLRSLVEAQRRSVDRYRDLRETIDGERRSLSELRDSVTAQRDVVTEHRDQLLAARARQDSLRAQAAGEEGRQQALLKDVRSKVKDYEAQIASLKKESDAIAALLRARQKANQKAAPTGKGVFSAPVSGAITSTFGNRLHPIFHTMRMHTGVDFAASTGTPVKAAADGVVFAAGERSGYGNTVILDHGNTLATLYAHLSRIAVADGATVTRGQVIGYAGSTGYATGPHLHFEVRVNGNPVDPLKYL
jgi:murein DD-endopeptidase MepM/ murein hydrolase activator NlpD